MVIGVFNRLADVFVGMSCHALTRPLIGPVSPTILSYHDRVGRATRFSLVPSRRLLGAISVCYLGGMTLSADDILGPNGRIAARLSNYEHRPQQLEMAEAVDAMRHATEAGRLAYVEGRIPKRLDATASSPEEGAIGRVPKQGLE